MISTHHRKYLLGLLGGATLGFAALVVPHTANSSPLVVSKPLASASLVKEARVVVYVSPRHRHRRRHWRCWWHRGRHVCGWRHW